MKPSALIHTYDTEYVFELLYSHGHYLTLDGLIEIRNQSALEEVEESEPAPKERIMTVSEFTEGLGFIETGIKVFRDFDSRVASSKN
jgi:hypothetical protein